MTELIADLKRELRRGNLLSTYVIGALITSFVMIVVLIGVLFATETLHGVFVVSVILVPYLVGRGLRAVLSDA